MIEVYLCMHVLNLHVCTIRRSQDLSISMYVLCTNVDVHCVCRRALLPSAVYVCMYVCMSAPSHVQAASLGIVLRFVRDVDSGKIVSAMQEALLPPVYMYMYVCMYVCMCVFWWPP